jgi:hypothetical protein
VAVAALVAAATRDSVEERAMKIETSGVIEELAAMPRRAAVEYCRERIEECSRAIDVAEGRAQPDPPRIVLAHAMPLPPRSRT